MSPHFGRLVLLAVAPLFVAPISVPLFGLAVLGYQHRASAGWKAAGIAGLTGYVLLGSWLGSMVGSA